MYHAVIADDEENALDELLYLIDWQAEGIQIDAAAHDGKEALELIEKYHPDFIFCDINMPKKTGLEVLRFLREKQYSTLFIAISAYSDFSYVRECLDNGAFTYLLKTVDKEELLSVLSKAKRTVDECHDAKRKELCRSALFALMSNHNSLQHLKDLHFNTDRPLFSAVQPARVLSAGIQKRTNCTLILMPNDHASVVIINHERDLRLNSLAEEFTPCGISAPHTNTANLYYEADCAFLSGEFFGRKVYFYRKSNRALIDSLQQNVSVASSPHEIALLLGNSLQSVNELCALYNAVMEYKDENALSYFDFCNEFHSLKEFSEFLFSCEKTESTPAIDHIIEQIHEYISTHYNENLSLHSLGEQFFISTSHLNRIFKKKYGITVNKFLTDTRMNKAMELIDGNNGMTLLKISGLVGYTDFYYFSRVFKKTFNCSPSRYKDDRNKSPR